MERKELVSGNCPEEAGRHQVGTTPIKGGQQLGYLKKGAMKIICRISVFKCLSGDEKVYLKTSKEGKIMGSAAKATHMFGGKKRGRGFEIGGMCGDNWFVRNQTMCVGSLCYAWGEGKEQSYTRC